MIELKENASEPPKAPPKKQGKESSLKKANFHNSRAGTVAFDSHMKSNIIESTPQGLVETEPLGTGVERKLTAEDKSKSAKSHPTEPILKASSSK